MPPLTRPLPSPRPAWTALTLVLLILQTTQAAHRHPRHNGDIAFADLILGKADIMTMGPEGSSTPRLLIEEGFNAHPAYSLDGSRLAFSCERDSENFEVYTARASDGLDQQRVTHSPGVGSYSMVPSFSCDGTHIAFEGQREGQAFSQAYVVRADGTGDATLIYPQPDAQQVGPKFSPNCKQLCFASTAGGAQDLYLVDVSHSYAFTNLRRLTTGVHNDFSRSWSPDSKQIVFNNQINGVGQLFIVTVRSGKVRRLTTNPGLFPGFTPGGIFPVFSGDVTPFWSPDGKKIIFSRQVAIFDGDTQGSFQVHSVKARRKRGVQPEPVMLVDGQAISMGWQAVKKRVRDGK